MTKEKILILGGTEFVGRLLVGALLQNPNYEIYLFNRGKTNPHLFPEVKKIIGDRETDDIKKIQTENWDYIIDFSSYFPASLKRTLKSINKNVKKYIYISTISVYNFKAEDLGKKITEDYPLLDYTPEEAVDKTMKTYGKKKVACEDVLNKEAWLNKIILRPSIIFGKYDPTDRFYYWPKKINTREEVILPNKGEDKLSLTFADDLVKIILAGINDRLPNGTYNCSTLPPISYNELFGIIKSHLNKKSQFIYADYKKLRGQKIRIPLAFIKNIWISNDKIKEVLSFKFNTMENAIDSLVEYYKKENWPTCKVGMDEDQESEIIARIKTSKF